jgi:hypothetical protein
LILTLPFEKVCRPSMPDMSWLHLLNQVVAGRATIREVTDCVAAIASGSPLPPRPDEAVQAIAAVTNTSHFVLSIFHDE